MAAYVPPGWPSGVHPPGTEDFERTAQAWLLDTVPPDYRLHGVLRRYPLALAAMAGHHARACVSGAREGYRTARTELGGALPPHALDAVLAAYRAEGRRLVATAQAVDLVARALRGEVFSPQLQETSGPAGRRGPPGGGAAPAGRPQGTGPRAEDRSGARRPAPRNGAEDQPGARHTAQGPDGTGDQLSARRMAVAPGAAGEQHATRPTAAGPGTGEQPGTSHGPTAAGTEEQLSARRGAAAPEPGGGHLSAGPRAAAPGTSGQDQLSAKRKTAGKSAESPAERPAREGPGKARKAPAAQRPARVNGGASRRKARPSDKQAAAG
jgi:hypothetical protein